MGTQACLLVPAWGFRQQERTQFPAGLVAGPHRRAAGDWLSSPGLLQACGSSQKKLPEAPFYPTPHQAHARGPGGTSASFYRVLINQG